MEVSVPTLLGLQGIKRRLPVLHCASKDAPVSHFPPSLLDVFRVAPRLQEVTIEGEGSMRELALSFSQLIRYETASKTVSLDNCPQLHVFAVTSRRKLDRIFQSVPTRPIVMSCTKLIRARLSEHRSRKLRSMDHPSAIYQGDMHRIYPILQLSVVTSRSSCLVTWSHAS